MALGKPIIDISLCKGCELCVHACPQKVLSMSAESNEQGVTYACFDDSDNCTACTFCALICPEYAINVIKYEGVRT
jgi:2-oxoglutarate ferredoxin oxidoreductase subunit delta